MFLRLPERIRPLYYVGFALALALFEIMAGSDLYCVGCIFLFIIISAEAFNRCGGLMWPSGSYIFFAALLTLIVGVTWKAVLWQPVDRNMKAPRLTFSVYLVGMAMMWVSAMVNSHLRTKKPIIKGNMPAKNSMRAAMGCVIVGTLIAFVVPLLSDIGLGSVRSILSQLNQFCALAIMLAVYYRVQETNGESSASGVAWVAATFTFLMGVLSFSKEGMFSAMAAWVIAALAAGYRTTTKQVIILCTCFVLVSAVIVPYSQYGRSHREEYASPFATVIALATNPTDIIEKGKSIENREAIYKFYDEPQGFFDRLNMLTLDDPLILRTEMGYPRGWRVVTDYVMNTFPHFLLSEKPDLHYGNWYAHEIGVLANDDEITGVSFSPFAEAFHVAGWLSLVVCIPLALIVLFWITDSFVGSLQEGPWTLFFTLTFAHAAPEGGIGGPFYLATYGLVRVGFAIFISLYIAPLIGSLIIGPERPQISQANLPRARSRVAASVPARRNVQ